MATLMLSRRLSPLLTSEYRRLPKEEQLEWDGRCGSAPICLLNKQNYRRQKCRRLQPVSARLPGAAVPHPRARTPCPPPPARLRRAPSTLHAVAITAATAYLFLASPVFSEDHVRSPCMCCLFAGAARLPGGADGLRGGASAFVSDLPARHPTQPPPRHARVQAGDVAFVLRTSPLSDAALGFSLGYFATDMLLLLVHYPAFGGPEMGVHHVAALLSVGAAALQVRRAPGTGMMDGIKAAVA